MKIGLISDTHGNTAAIDQAVELVPQGRLICGFMQGI